MKTNPSITLLASALIALCLCGPAVAADSHRKAVEKLLELTLMQEKIVTSVNNVVALQLRQDPAMRPHEDLLRDYLEQQIGWKALKAPLVDMYQQTFTENELDEINAFYESATGRKLVESLPALIKRRDRLAMQRMQDNIGELKSKIEAKTSR